ncbi:MAG: hypothetical protein WCF93_00800 [Candidatus Moraniibacteriota bacterium]
MKEPQFKMPNPEKKVEVKNEKVDSKFDELFNNQNVKSFIELDFFRHSNKEKDKEKTDIEISLTPEGKKNAIDKASIDTDIEQSIAFGAAPERTGLTSMLVMGGQEESITGEETFNELRDKLDAGIAVGSKLGIDNRLDFKADENSKYYAELADNFINGKYLVYLIEQSDQRAKDFGDDYTATYSRMAQQVAQIIEKYQKISPRWSQLVEDKSAEYTKALQRFMGTQQGVGECFLAKVIELTNGAVERDKFVEALGKKQGFDFLEGLRIFVVDDDGDRPKLFVEYKHKDKEDASRNFEFVKEIDPALIEKIASGM